MGLREKKDSFKREWNCRTTTNPYTEIWEPIQKPATAPQVGEVSGRKKVDESQDVLEPVEDERSLNIRAPKLLDAPKTAE